MPVVEPRPFPAAKKSAEKKLLSRPKEPNHQSYIKVKRGLEVHHRVNSSLTVWTAHTDWYDLAELDHYRRTAPEVNGWSVALGHSWPKGGDPASGGGFSSFALVVSRDGRWLLSQSSLAWPFEKVDGYHEEYKSYERDRGSTPSMIDTVDWSVLMDRAIVAIAGHIA